jgi:3-methyl-2-oxobutanoate hydroxymethyltransferase
MSAQTQTQRVTTRHFRDRKGGEPLVVLTAYTTPMARMLDPHVDCLMVGDSLGMVLYGMDTTLSVTLEMMIAHGRAVVRGSQKALVVVDMPFGSYQESPEQAFRSAARVLAETGAQAIKLEGGRQMAKTIEFLATRGIPVMANIGLMPQSVNNIGGFRAQGKSAIEEEQVLEDARAIDQSGAFAMVVEGTYESLARMVTGIVTIPTIGIGASPACDGQVLVSDDMLGLTSGPAPRFVKRYARLDSEIEQAVQTYAQEVRARTFPQLVHCYGVKTEK